MDPEEIDDRLKAIGEDSEFPRNEITGTLSRLPADVCNWVLESVVFLAPPDANGVAYTFAWNPPAQTAAEEAEDESRNLHLLRIVYLPPRLFDEPLPEIQRVIAHEVAHHWLRHDGPAAAGENYQQREDEVEEQLKAWCIQS